ncbi:uncharacterized protein ACA1_074940 [Acanthamoeba castellanii str. Neff]|uniref:Uncharacterized protein n=1 Tax=Acanthamoeba castellanii (strain ATCC 30010 / Neff) TaxID=1257118 RepID=L8HF99_ACACF|nr:uncharacterized protein ACA1_074940 [Acanthamoeba castellanii str. Neff]ELR23927.1 hypothetical protein ACA1_074940 [Acanthamoeba castellanii str. Neff]
MEEERKAREQSEAKAKARATDTPTSPSTEGHEEYVCERRQLEETTKRALEENDKLKHEHSAFAAKLKAKSDCIEALKYQLEAKLGDKEKQLAALATKVSRSDDLIDMFELNFKQVQQEVEELSAAFRMERDTGIVSLRSAPIALTRSLSD